MRGIIANMHRITAIAPVTYSVKLLGNWARVLRQITKGDKSVKDHFSLLRQVIK